MATADVQHVMGDVSPGHIFRDHRQTIRTIGPGSLNDVRAIHHGRGRHRVHIEGIVLFSYVHILGCGRDAELKMKNRIGVGNDGEILLRAGESGLLHGQCVISDWHNRKGELSVLIGVDGLRPSRVFRLQDDACPGNGAMLRVVNHPSHTAKDSGRQVRTGAEKRSR